MAYHFLLSLFSTPQEADAIEGDLCEERASIAARDGDRTAARWYRRQLARSVIQLAMAPFREAPFAMISLGIVGIASTWPIAWLTTRSAETLVLNVPVYQYLPASTFWQLIAFPPMVCVGLIIALMRGRRAMSTALAVFFAMAFVVCVVDPIMMLTFIPPRQQQMSLWFWGTRALYALVAWGGVMLVSTAIGITLRRKNRVA